LIRDFLGPDIEVILKGLKKACGLVEKKKSNEIESNIIRLSVKVIILYRDKIVTDAGKNIYLIYCMDIVYVVYLGFFFIAWCNGIQIIIDLDLFSKS
jgi:hypothetical protein